MAKYREKKGLHNNSNIKGGGDGSKASPQPSKDSKKPTTSAVGGKAPISRAQVNVDFQAHANPIYNYILTNITAQVNVDEEILVEKEQQIRELQETVEILELKVAKLEQLIRLKDNKIQKLIQMSSTEK